MNPQVWWYVARSAGIIAWLLLTLSVCWGLFVSTKAVAKASAPAWLLDLHRFLSGFAVVFTGVHLFGLVADGYVHFGLAELFVPMAADWKPGPVAWGIVSLYVLLAVELTSLLMKRLPRRWWRAVHRTSLPLYAVATYHGLAAGTDAGNEWFRLATLASVHVVAFLTVLLILTRRRAFIGAATGAPRAPATGPAADAVA